MEDFLNKSEVKPYFENRLRSSGEGEPYYRASALGQRLLDSGYDVQFFCSGDATEPLTAKFGENRIHDLPSPRFVYNDKGQLVVWKTGRNFIKFMLGERKRILRLSTMLREKQFDVVISDFEPLMVERMLTPLVSSILKVSWIFVKSHLNMVFYKSCWLIVWLQIPLKHHLSCGLPVEAIRLSCLDDS